MNGAIRNITKGNTEIVAEEISKLTGADLFKVETVNAYPYNYQECCDVAKAELITHEGSGLGSVMDDVRKLCPNAKVDSSLSIVGSRSENAKEELKRWCI